MPEAKENSAVANHTVVTRSSDRELMVTRSFAAPARIVFEAWSKPELFRTWWVPKSAPITLISCEMDVRTGGQYRIVFAHPPAGEPMAFFGTYKDVVENERIVWTNEESDQGALTTVTFEERDGNTLVTYRETYPTTEALEEALTGSAEGLPEQFAQLADLLGVS